MNTKRICLWSSPRNISTAMMYAFAQRLDTVVYDEPLYAHYLQTTGIQHPGREEILQSQEQDGELVIKNILLALQPKPIAFFKQMTHHLLNLNDDFLAQMYHIIFIRDPKQIISSYAQVRPDVTIQDVGIAAQWNLYNRLQANNYSCIVLDCNELLTSADVVLQKLCDVLYIPFYTQMLKWPAGPKKEDGVWAKYWYSNVHQSTHFEQQTTSNRLLPEYLLPLYNECKQYYDLLQPLSIKA